MSDENKGIGSLYPAKADSTIAKPVVQAATEQAPRFLSEDLTPLDIAEFKVTPVKVKKDSDTPFVDSLNRLRNKSTYGKVKILPKHRRAANAAKKAADAFAKERDREVTVSDWKQDNKKWRTHLADVHAEATQKIYYDSTLGSMVDMKTGEKVGGSEALKEQQKISKLYKELGADETMSKFKNGR